MKKLYYLFILSICKSIDNLKNRGEKMFIIRIHKY